MYSNKFGGAPKNWAPQNGDIRAGVFYPTLSIVTEVKKDPRDSKWLFMRIRCLQVRNGRFDTEVTVVDEGGDLVCLSKHVSLVMLKKSLEEMKEIYKL